MQDGVVFVERHVTNERKQTFAMRKSQAALERNLRPEFIDAMREIEFAFNADMESMGYVTWDYNVQGRSGDAGLYEMTEHQLDIIQRSRSTFAQWSKSCDDRVRGICLDICVFGFTVNDVARNRGMRKENVTGSLCIGLNEWCILRGWGNFFA